MSSMRVHWSQMRGLPDIDNCWSRFVLGESPLDVVLDTSSIDSKAE